MSSSRVCERGGAGVARQRFHRFGQQEPFETSCFLSLSAKSVSSMAVIAVQAVATPCSCLAGLFVVVAT